MSHELISAARPRVIAHRGDHRAAAENSLAAFDAAVRSGCDMIETDLRRCRDGIVACHDARAGGRLVAFMSRREIGAATGLLPPSLDEVLECCRGRIGINLELKEEGLEADVLDVVTPAFSPSQYLISSFRPAVLRTVRALDSASRTGLLSARGLGRLMRSHGFEPDPRPAAAFLATVRDCGADVLIPDVLDRELIALAADRGTAMIVWSANTARQIAGALAIAGVAGVITDDPPVAQRCREDMHGPGLSLPGSHGDLGPLAGPGARTAQAVIRVPQSWSTAHSGCRGKSGVLCWHHYRGAAPRLGVAGMGNAIVGLRRSGDICMRAAAPMRAVDAAAPDRAQPSGAGSWPPRSGCPRMAAARPRSRPVGQRGGRPGGWPSLRSLALSWPGGVARPLWPAGVLTAQAPPGPSSRPASGAAAARAQAAAWIAGQVSSDAVVACDPGMCAALESRGMPAGRMMLLRRPAAGDLLGAGVIVALSSARQPAGQRVRTRPPGELRLGRRPD